MLSIRPMLAECQYLHANDAMGFEPALHARNNKIRWNGGREFV